MAETLRLSGRGQRLQSGYEKLGRFGVLIVDALVRAMSCLWRFTRFLSRFLPFDDLAEPRFTQTQVFQVWVR